MESRFEPVIKIPDIVTIIVAGDNDENSKNQTGQAEPQERPVSSSTNPPQSSLAVAAIHNDFTASKPNTHIKSLEPGDLGHSTPVSTTSPRNQLELADTRHSIPSLVKVTG
ncbi:hypothetical protein DRE_03915 [Drechslerella stenobrocha 248]|uniref:Uncharacterized protein n=1 Tax=Drechslerella stenobrocha 248 TaxID=1043628 RepID=W7I3V5_9PEZI|nr:hypothetical protein DRE_03915 [Drechslerella stenobrocha 248]